MVSIDSVLFDLVQSFVEMHVIELLLPSRVQSQAVSRFAAPICVVESVFVIMAAHALD